MAQKKNVSILTEAQLNKLSTQRLLALKKTVTAKKSALYNRNACALVGVPHPFDLPLYTLMADFETHADLEIYNGQIKEILSTRENIK
jgi:hypothetical protein